MARIHDIISCMQGVEEGGIQIPDRETGVGNFLEKWICRSGHSGPQIWLITNYNINPYIPIALKYLSYLSKVMGLY